MFPSHQHNVPTPIALEVEGENGPVPTLYWEPNCKPRGLVLACHGGSGHKSSPAVLAVVEKCVPLGFTVLAMDGPVHGERSDGNLDPMASRQRFLQDWTAGTSNASMAKDMQSALDALLQVPLYANCPVGYIGVSMGTAYGIPLLAVEPRIQAAAIGMWSGRAKASEHLLTAAREIRCATWFTQQWNDEFFDREGTLELFDAIGAIDKLLVAYPGTHIELQDARLDDAVTFLAKHLVNKSSSSSASHQPQGAKMPTINPTPEQMESRIVRADKIQPFKIGMKQLHGIPPEALEAISAKTIYLYMNPPRGDWTDKLAGVSGSPGLQVSVCHCPPGQGPELHAHERTVENFFCLKGEFKIVWGDEGQFDTHLKEHDMISMPPKVMRRFSNVGTEDAILLVLIQGPDSDLSTDVQYAPSLGKSLADKYGAEVRAEIENMGWRFDAVLASQVKADA